MALWLWGICPKYNGWGEITTSGLSEGGAGSVLSFEQFNIPVDRKTIQITIHFTSFPKIPKFFMSETFNY
jgi:hypothetical protein